MFLENQEQFKGVSNGSSIFEVFFSPLPSAPLLLWQVCQVLVSVDRALITFHK